MLIVYFEHAGYEFGLRFGLLVSIDREKKQHHIFSYLKLYVTEFL